MPATSSNVTPMSSWAYSLPRLRPKAIAEPAPPSRRIMKKMNSDEQPGHDQHRHVGSASRWGLRSCRSEMPFSSSSSARRLSVGFRLALKGDVRLAPALASPARRFACVTLPVTS